MSLVDATSVVEGTVIFLIIFRTLVKTYQGVRDAGKKPNNYIELKTRYGVRRVRNHRKAQYQ